MKDSMENNAITSIWIQQQFWERARTWNCMNPLTKSSVPCVAFSLCHTIKQNKTEYTNPRNFSQTLLEAGNLSETTPQGFIMYKQKRRKYRENKGEKNTISAPLGSTAVRQSVKMRSLSASTLTSNCTLTLLKICKTGH